MATPNYGWVLPTVNADFGAWGGILNTAITAVDSTVKSLDVRLAAAEAELAGPIISNSDITAAGSIYAGARVQAAQFQQGNTAAGNNTLHVPLRLEVGPATGSPLGPLYAITGMVTSNVGSERYVITQIGDNASLRKYGIKGSQVYIGQSDPTFIGGEQLYVAGDTRIVGVLNVNSTLNVNGSSSVTGSLTAATFFGSGAGLTSIPQAGVVGLPSFVTGTSNSIALLDAGKSNVGHGHNISDINALATQLDSKSNVGHTHDAGDIVSGQLPLARINFGGPVGWPTQNTGTRLNAVVGSVNSGQTVTTSAGPGQPFPEVTAINNAFSTLSSALRQLIADLTARGVI